jgi:DNA transformation protein
VSTSSLRNIGPKSAAWLRQVGLRSAQDLAEVGAVQAFAKIRRAGFKPSLNLLYSLEGALLDCHWHDVPEERRQQLLAELEQITAALPPARGRPVAGPVTTRFHDGEAAPAADDADATDAPADGPANRFD